MRENKIICASLIWLTLNLCGQNLKDAIKAGNLPIVQKLISEDGNLVNKKISGQTPLYIATKLNQKAIVNYLLQKGANPNAPSEGFYNDYPLYIAAQKGYLNIVKSLVKARADVNKTVLVSYANEVNPTEIAIKNKNLQIANYLLDNGATIHDKILVEAIKTKNTRIIESIVFRFKKRQIPLSALAAAINTKQPIIFRYLTNNFKVALEGTTKVRVPFSQKEEQDVKKLYYYGGIDNKTVDATLLYLAVLNNLKDIVTYLLSKVPKSINVPITEYLKVTYSSTGPGDEVYTDVLKDTTYALTKALKNKQFDIAKILINKGATISEKDIKLIEGSKDKELVKMVELIQRKERREATEKLMGSFGKKKKKRHDKK